MQAYLFFLLFAISRLVFADIQNISVNEQELYPNFQQSQINYSPRTLNVLNFNKICIVGDNYSIKYHNKIYVVDKSGCVNLKVLKVSKTETVVVTDNFNRRNYRLQLLPETFPELRTTGKISQKYLLFTLNNKFDRGFPYSYLVIVDKDNNIVYFQYFIGKNVAVGDFKLQGDVYSFWLSHNMVEGVGDKIVESGNIYKLSSNFSPYQMKSESNNYFDVHDFKTINGKNINFYYLLQPVPSAYFSSYTIFCFRLKDAFFNFRHIFGSLYHKFFPDNNKDGSLFTDFVHGFITSLQNIGSNKVWLYVPIVNITDQNGVVLNTINLLNYPELFSDKSLLNSAKFFDGSMADYFHLNSVFTDPSDDGLVLSFRHLNQVIKINPSNKKLVWRLGGVNSDFNLSESQQFSGQHFAYFVRPNSLIIFDNGNLKQKTKVLEFNLDQVNKKIIGFKDLYTLDSFSKAMGNAEELTNGNIIIGTGYHPESGNDIIEIDKISKPVFTMRFQSIYPYTSYRAYEYESIPK